MVTITPSAVLRLEVETTPPAGKSKNLVKNPDGALGGFFWVTPTGGGVSVAASGAFSAYVNRYTHGAGGTGWRSERMPVTAGQYVSARWFLGTPGAVTVTTTIVFENSSGVVVGTTAASPAYGNAPTTERLYGPYLAPAGTANARLVFTPSGAVAGNVIEFAGVGFVARASSTPITVWLTDVVQAGPTWLDVLAPSIEIEVEKEALDLGTLNAVIRDATLDPISVPTIRPGRACRLMALHAVTAVWEPLFVGEITDFDVQYEAAVLAKNPTDPKHCKITIAAADRTRILASTRRPEGVAALYDLRESALEDAGVPWEINGNNAHTGALPTVVSYNDNATALDQVAITRDSLDAHAWVDRRGILQVWERAKLNPFANTGLEVDTAQWVQVVGTISRVTTPTASGVGALQVVTTGATATIRTAQTRTIPGHSYTVTVKHRAAAVAGRQCRVQLSFRDWAGNLVSTVNGSYSTMIVGAWATSTVTAVAPVEARNVYADVSFNLTAAGETYYLDDLSGLNAEVTLDQAVWSDIEIGAGSKSTINEVSVDFLRYVPAAGTEPAKSEVIPYGPYRNEASIAEYGVRPAKFTIHGTNETTLVATVAAAVLAANGVPKVQARSVKFAVKSAADLVMSKALGDLYQTAFVSFATKGYSAPLRITGLRHTIKADPQYGVRWIVEYSFESTSVVAAPRPIASPAGAAIGTLSDTPWIEPALTGGFSTYVGNEPFGYRRINGIVYIKGLIGGAGNNVAFFFLPAGFRPKASVAQIQQSVSVNGGLQTLYIRTSDGAMFFPAVGPGAAGYAFLNDVRPWPADA